MTEDTGIGERDGIVAADSEAGVLAEDGSGDAVSVVRELAPPPPSAPREFLYAQWRDGQSFRFRGRLPDYALAAPPPSAPAEFLESQWTYGVPPEPGVDFDLSEFEAAFPTIVATADELDRLLREASAAADSARLEADQPAVAAPVATPRIRGFPLLKDEQVNKVLLPNEGMTDDVPPTGQALILTNLRLIAFRGVEGFRDTHVARTTQITQCSVRTGQRNWGAVLQGLMIMVGGAFLYLVVGYWLAGQISGPNVPVLNMDVAPFIALLIILAGVFVLLQNYFTRPAGAVVFHGPGVEIVFPFRSSLDVTQVYDFVDMAQFEEDPADDAPTGET